MSTRCECCDMTEEYTAEYIQSVRNLFAGKFVCGLCSEAVKYEIFRRCVGVDEALAIHMSFHGEFVASSLSPTIDFISAIGEMFRRRLILDLPRTTLASTDIAPVSIVAVESGGICAAAVIGGTGSCLPALSGGV
ncbi:unnamed protein product [Arabis nemorensis]|uniref:DUF1677 domain-containing protein n=1 Tax=Arabis nemorensis TaxID=586526 RepID=A0A565BF75_9BRAS|nr:unnamed protein product [Arabis nemorensis]